MSVINFSGIASGIDTAGLIEATSDAARQTKVKPSQKKVSELQETNSAMEDLNKKLESLKSLLRGFSTLNGGGVSKTGTSSKESVVTATATNGAANGSYDVTVNTLAKNHIYTFDQTFSSAEQALQGSLTGLETEADRTVTFTVGTGTNTETVNIVITDGAYSVGDFVNAFNLKSSKSEASLVNVGTSASPSYKILISSNYEGTEKGTISRTALGASLTNLTAYSESAAVNASLTISGLGTLTRPTNSVADVLPGVTLSLVSTGSATVKVAEDPTTTGSKVQEFVDSYNEIVKFLGENNQIARDESGTEVKNVFGPLASTRTDDNALNALRTALSGAVATGGSTIRIFPDIGITTERDGSLKFDSTKFQAAVSAEPSSVSSILTQFADTTSLTGGTIDIYTRFNGLIDVTLNGNKTLITDLNTRIADAERAIAKQAEDMKARFARLESLMGRLQQQQSSLSSALAGLR
jgi:flagellar hook-associated protein 2